MRRPLWTHQYSAFHLFHARFSLETATFHPVLSFLTSPRASLCGDGGISPFPPSHMLIFLCNHDSVSYLIHRSLCLSDSILLFLIYVVLNTERSIDAIANSVSIVLDRSVLYLAINANTQINGVALIGIVSCSFSSAQHFISTLLPSVL